MNKPKYQIGQKVWNINCSKASEEEVTGIAFYKDNFVYSLELMEYEEKLLITRWVGEYLLFPTKEELTKSL